MAKKKKTVVVVSRKNKKKPKRQTNEVTRLGSALRSLGGLGGSALGSLVGMPITGSSVGSSLGAALSRWLGSGDYTVSSNSIVQRTMSGSSSVPAMHNQNQSVVVRHREFLGEIKGSTAFTIQGEYVINPGMSSTFPWLSGIAANFQEYRFKGVVFHYVSTSGTAVSGTNPAIGSVMMQTTYRSNDVPPATKIDMLNEYWACESGTAEAFAHPIECSPKENPFSTQWIRTTSVPTGDNMLLYDLGKMFIATSGQPAAGNPIGDLWVTYEVELRKPVTSSNVTSTNLFYQCKWNVGGGSWFANPVSAPQGNLNLTIDTSAPKISLPVGLRGTFLVCASFTMTGTSTNNFAISALSNCVLSTNIVPQSPCAGTGPASFTCFALLTILDPMKSAGFWPSGSYTPAAVDTLTITISRVST